MGWDMIKGWCLSVKCAILKWWNRSKKKLLCFSVSVRYISLILIFLFGYVGSMNFCGFGVDSAGKLYIGRKTKIEIYQDGKITDVLPTPFQKEGWHMGISPDDQIIACGSNSVYTLQLNGTVIDEQKDVNSKMSNALYKQRQIDGNDGNQYRLRHKWIWPTITKNGRAIYMAPIVDMLGRVNFMLFFAVVVPGIIYEVRSEQKKKKSSTDE